MKKIIVWLLSLISDPIEEKIDIKPDYAEMIRILEDLLRGNQDRLEEYIVIINSDETDEDEKEFMKKIVISTNTTIKMIERAIDDLERKISHGK